MKASPWFIFLVFLACFSESNEPFGANSLNRVNQILIFLSF